MAQSVSNGIDCPIFYHTLILNEIAISFEIAVITTKKQTFAKHLSRTSDSRDQATFLFWWQLLDILSNF